MVNQTDLFRDALVKVLAIARTGARDEAAWNEVQAIATKAFDEARRRDTAEILRPLPNDQTRATNATWEPEHRMRRRNPFSRLNQRIGPNNNCGFRYQWPPSRRTQGSYPH